MHIVVNGWFAGQSTTGSGQYTDQIVRHLAAAGHRVTLVVGDWGSGIGDWGLGTGDSSAAGQLEIMRVELGGLKVAGLSRRSQSPVPSPQSPITKIWWEQITVPRAAQRLNADVLLVPYWAAPWWQPVPTVVTVHDVVQLILPEYRGGRLFQLYLKLVSATGDGRRRCSQ
ncbi:MAG: glycosyltransferase [Caldilineaceae bacterium]